MLIRRLIVAASLAFFGTPLLKAQDPKAEIAGYWDWTFGNVFFKTAPLKGKNHLDVTGWYLAGPDQKGTITSGTYDPATGTLEYTFVEPWHPGAKGSARYKLSADGKQFNGHSEIADIKNDPTMTRVHGDTFDERMDAIAGNAGIKADTPGAAVLVVESGRVIFEKGYGVVHFKNKKPITPVTTFELCSCSKQFTGTAILLLHERGLLGLEDDARKYLPELPEYDKKNPITVLHLVRHISGLSEYDWSDPNVKRKNPKFATNEDFLLEMAAHRDKYPLLFTPGAKEQYTNTNYMLLALISERVSKKSLGVFLKSEIFDPLGMNTATVFERPSSVIKEPALGHVLEKGKFKAIWGPAPYFEQSMMSVGDGNIWMSITDLAAWDAGWRQGKVLKAETIKRWLVPSKTRDGKANGYAFGWGVSVEEGKLVHMGHGGGGGGFVTSIERDLASNRTTVVLCNWDKLDPSTIGGSLEHLCWAMPHKGFWRHDKGYFEHTGKNRWTENGPGGALFRFVEVKRTDTYVELFDKGRQCTVRLSPTECQVKFENGNFEKFYTGKWANQ
jgi:CubicO group peptidase (beta-lactamase class C family)